MSQFLVAPEARHVATMHKVVWTIGRLLNWTTEYLRRHNSESPRLDAEVLLAYTLGCQRIALYTRFAKPADESVCGQFRKLVAQRAAGAPVAYLVGHKEFFSLSFEVSRDVLIPRPDSELVVLELLRVAGALSSAIAIDIGTGSGNLAVAAAHQHPDLRIFGVDNSARALELARINAVKHGVGDRIELLHGDLFGPIAQELQADCIMSNPPYIPTAEIACLPVGVRDYEPHAALDGGPTGLEVVGRLVEQAGRHLKPAGQLILEIGTDQEKAVRNLIEQQGGYELLATIRDYAGHPRVVSARRIEIDSVVATPGGDNPCQANGS